MYENLFCKNKTKNRIKKINPLSIYIQNEVYLSREENKIFLDEGVKK